MMAYREQRRRIATAEALRRIAEASGFERQMEFGEFEAGVADALCPECDSDLPALRALREGQWQGLALPDEIEVSKPEGFAYYALDPELYRLAARRLAAAMRPRQVAVIGIRSIGTTLSSLVEAELRTLGVETKSWTVRPRGHPWDRQLVVATDLEQAWREWPGHFAIVDEGPGISGTSFSSVADYLCRLGVKDDRIALIPSWRTDGSGLRSAAARSHWKRHRQFTADFEELGRFTRDRDLSGGKWREVTGSGAPAYPRQERRKYLRGERLYKFAGYGRYGRALLDRALALAEFIPPVHGLEDGFLICDWVPAQAARVSTEFLDHAARYLAFVQRSFPANESATPLEEMIAVNTGVAWDGPRPDLRPVFLDGHMMPHEWLKTPGGWLKADALEHHDDHFYPGPQDIAWDLAGLSIEFGLEPEAERYLVERFSRLSGDRAAARMPFYRAAYLAFRLGYAELAGEPARHERARYAAILKDEPWMRSRSRLSA